MLDRFLIVSAYAWFFGTAGNLIVYVLYDVLRHPDGYTVDLLSLLLVTIFAVPAILIYNAFIAVITGLITVHVGRSIKGMTSVLAVGLISGLSVTSFVYWYIFGTFSLMYSSSGLIHGAASGVALARINDA